MHIPSMRKRRTRLLFFTLTVIGQLSIPWSKLAANQNDRKSVDRGTCDTSPGFLCYSHRRFRREWFFETLARQDSSKALIPMKKNLTCQFVWISFLIIKRERLNGRSQ